MYALAFRRGVKIVLAIPQNRNQWDDQAVEKSHEFPVGNGPLPYPVGNNPETTGTPVFLRD